MRAGPSLVEERAPRRREPRGGRGGPPIPRAASGTRDVTPGSSSGSSRGSRLRPKEEARWAEESVGSTELFDHLARSEARLRPRVLRPVPVRDDARRRAAGARPRRPDPVPPRRALRPPRRRPRGVPGLPGLHLQLAARGGPGREALRHRRPAGRRRRARLRPPPPADPAAFRRRHGLEGPLLVYLGRKETGKNVPLLIEYALRYRALRRADLTLVLAGDGPVTAPPDTPGVRDLGYLDPAAQGGGLRGRRGGLPAVGQRVLLDRPDGGLARGDAGPRPRAVRGHHAPRLQRRRRSRLRGLLRVRGGAGPPPRGHASGAAASASQGRAYVETEYSWPAVTARLRETLERLVA